MAVAVAVLGWLIAHSFYHRKPERRARFTAAIHGVYSLVANKYYIDELYNVLFVKPLLALSRYVLGWVVDTCILGGTAWLLGGTATFGGAILQRWQSGNLRSYAAWLTLGAAAVLIFALLLSGHAPGHVALLFTHFDGARN